MPQGLKASEFVNLYQSAQNPNAKELTILTRAPSRRPQAFLILRPRGASWRFKHARRKWPPTIPGCQKVGGPFRYEHWWFLELRFSLLFSTTRLSSTDEKLVLCKLVRVGLVQAGSGSGVLRSAAVQEPAPCEVGSRRSESTKNPPGRVPTRTSGFFPRHLLESSEN